MTARGARSVTPRHVALRAAVLVLMWAGFYLLGLAVVAGLLWVPWAQLAYGDSLDPGGVLAGVGGVWLLWGLRPRSRQQHERGEALSPEAHAKLHALVANVARRVGHPVPDELHLLAEANAFAAQQSHWLRRNKSIVGIGLPYLAWLDNSGVEAVIAHELGHHVAGDVRLGPWVHRTRSLMGQALDHIEGSAFWLDLPFVGYARGFVRYSAGVSRAQEVAADAVSARVAGAEAAARALVGTELSAVWQAYLSSEITPMLNAGFLPPLLEGFRHFEAAWRKHADRDEDAGVPDDEPSELDTHPTLAERLSALGVPKPSAAPGAGSLCLLDDAAAAEEYVLRQMLKDPKMRLERLPWAEAGKRLWLPRYRSSLEPFRRELARLTPEAMPTAVQHVAEWAQRLRTGLALYSDEANRRHVIGLFGMWFVVYLAELGFELEALPGQPVRGARGALTLEPFNEVSRLFEGKTSATDWAATCLAMRTAAEAS